MTETSKLLTLPRGVFSVLSSFLCNHDCVALSERVQHLVDNQDGRVCGCCALFSCHSELRRLALDNAFFIGGCSCLRVKRNLVLRAFCGEWENIIEETQRCTRKEGRFLFQRIEFQSNGVGHTKNSVDNASGLFDCGVEHGLKMFKLIPEAGAQHIMAGITGGSMVEKPHGVPEFQASTSEASHRAAALFTRKHEYPQWLESRIGSAKSSGFLLSNPAFLKNIFGILEPRALHKQHAQPAANPKELNPK